MLFYNIADCQPYPDVSLTYERMCRQTFGVENFGSYNAMPHVWLVTHAQDRGGMCAKHSYIMQQGCFVEETAVYIELGVHRGQFIGQLGHPAAVIPHQV